MSQVADHHDFLYDTHPLKKAGDFLLQFFRVGRERVRTLGNLIYAACSRFGGFLDRLYFQGNASDIFGGSLDALGNVRRRVTLFVDR